MKYKINLTETVLTEANLSNQLKRSFCSVIIDLLFTHPDSFPLDMDLPLKSFLKRQSLFGRSS